MIDIKKKKFKPIVHFFLISIIIIFFSINLFTGERNFFKRDFLDLEIRLASEKLTDLENKNLYLSHKIKLLNSENVDSDLISEYARKFLGLYNKNEILILLEQFEPENGLNK